MTATIRTLAYAGVAVVFALSAYVTHRLTLPPDLAGFERVGQKFFPNFDDPDKAVRLRVAAYDDLSQSPRVFTVEKHGESWRIPSHHDYPAEAKKQLARTAASVIGVERSAVASRRKADHERLGVIDPLDEKSTALRGRGRRITLYDDAGTPLIDLIIGNAVEGQENQNYVRVPTEKETYRSSVEVKLSTKFSDWIEPDLLKLTGSDVVSLEKAETVYEDRLLRNVLGGAETRRVPVGQHVVAHVTRKESFGDWTMQDLNELIEELDDAPLRDAVSALDDLKIEGVRPKMQGVTADLQVDFPPDVIAQPDLRGPFIMNLRADLEPKGFEIAYDQDENLFVASPNGEVTAATSKGVVYHLHFGKEITGTEEEIQIGTSSEKGDDAAADGGPDGVNGDEGDKPSGGSPDENGQDGKNPGRFLFVRVEFDPQFIGPEPVAPVEPQKPPELEKPADSEAPADDAPESATNNDESGDAAAAGETQNQADPPANENDESDTNGETDDKSEAELEYEKAMSDYRTAKRKYDTDKADYDEKVTNGQKLVEQLNDRFKEWYYVVSAESFEKLELSRDMLVTSRDAAILSEEPVEAPLPPAEDASEPE